MREFPTKPYLLRAIYEWCCDCGFTPHLTVRVDAKTRVPPQYVKDGEIVLNVSQSATRNLTLGNEVIQFSARFGGASHELSIPIDAVAAIFARENGQGLIFQTTPAPEEDGPKPMDGESSGSGRARLQVVK
jgi:stringent starvation protein B